MISADNPPLNQSPSDLDFTTEAYRVLIRLAVNAYPVATYCTIPWADRFLLWRHDCDYSLNRALALADIEAQEGLRSTFFLNPHCEFYNLLQADQVALVQKILMLGHDIGLHFDAAFYATATEIELDDLVAREATLLEQVFGSRPTAFSFHNPSAFHLSCEAEKYGNLVNCYSRKFKTEVPYCSDSNGYWRFRRLQDVLSEAKDTCLQVLTHPEWWQETMMPPRQRIFRSVYGRAHFTMRLYDAALEDHGRQNLAGSARALLFLRQLNPRTYRLCDMLWMDGEFQTLFVELWRLHESQINRLCKAVFRKQWQVPASEVNAFFDHEGGIAVDGWRLFSGLFEGSWQSASGQSEAAHSEWTKIRNQLVHGRGSIEAARLEEGCVYLCSVIEAISRWAKASSIAYDGLAHLGSIGLPTYKTADGSLGDRLEEVKGDIPGFPNKKWEVFKAKMRCETARSIDDASEGR